MIPNFQPLFNELEKTPLSDFLPLVFGCEVTELEQFIASFFLEALVYLFLSHLPSLCTKYLIVCPIKDTALFHPSERPEG